MVFSAREPSEHEPRTRAQARWGTLTYAAASALLLRRGLAQVRLPVLQSHLHLQHRYTLTCLLVSSLSHNESTENPEKWKLKPVCLLGNVKLFFVPKIVSCHFNETAKISWRIFSERSLHYTACVHAYTLLQGDSFPALSIASWNARQSISLWSGLHLKVRLT